jgi:arylsulfatase A-like enzyme/Flp pilus assembly protein TadD
LAQAAGGERGRKGERRLRARRAGRITRRAALCLVALLAGCGPREPAPSILLVSIDTLRPDRLGCGGDPLARTPWIDRLARRSVQWAVCVSSQPQTLPSHATLLTGLRPFRHGARKNDSFAFHPDAAPLAVELSESGWRTGAVLGSFVLDERFRLGEGFATWEAEFGADPPGSWPPGRRGLERRASRVTDRALAWLAERDGEEPWFLLAHYYDPHDDYLPPSPYDRIAPDAYRGEVAYADREVGRLLSGIGPASGGAGVVVCLTSDHGEALGEHGETSHGFFIYETTMRVPLIVSGPGIGPGLRPDLARLVDVTPTLAALAGRPADPARDGRDLLSAPNGAPAGSGEPEPAYVESFVSFAKYGATELRGLRTGRWKYVRAPRPELYDLERDPGETRNLLDPAASGPGEAVAPEAARIHRDLDAQLRSLVGEDLARPRGVASVPEDPETLRRLEALGYLSSAPGASVENPNRRDPKDVHPTVEIVDDAIRLAGEGDEEAAMTLFSRALEIDPLNTQALWRAAGIHARRGEPDQALALYERAVALDPENAGLETALGSLLLRLGRVDKASRAFDRALALDPTHLAALINRAGVRLRAGDPSGARTDLEAVLAVDPTNPEAHRWLERLSE